MNTRREFVQTLSALGALGSAAWPFVLHAQALDVCKIISGFPPGGTVDSLARRVADKLRGSYCNTVLVENKPGAAGQIGVITLRDSKPDGSAMLLTPSSMLSIYPFTYPTLQYKLEDVIPVSVGGFINHGLAVGPAVPESVKTLKDFLAWSKANPEKASYGSPGAGSMPHMIGALLTRASGTELRHVAYRGAAPGVQDLLGGQISSFLGPIGDFIPHQKSGRLRVLAISGKERSPFVQGVPTLRELGYAITVREWYAFFLPKGTAPETVQRASSSLKTALAQPDVIEAGKQFGVEVESSSAQALAELLKADANEWRELIKEIGFTAES